MITRRALLNSTALIAVALLDEGCAAVAALPQYAQDAEDVAGALNAALPTISSIVGLAQTAQTAVSAAITKISTVAGQITAAVAAGSSGSTVGALVTSFGNLFKQISDAANGAGSVSGVLGAALQAGEVVVPLVLQAAGVVGIALAASPTVSAGPPLSPAQARAILKGLAAK